jgi:hypothetical protein
LQGRKHSSDCERYDIAQHRAQNRDTLWTQVKLVGENLRREHPAAEDRQRKAARGQENVRCQLVQRSNIVALSKAGIEPSGNQPFHKLKDKTEARPATQQLDAEITAATIVAPFDVSETR